MGLSVPCLNPPQLCLKRNHLDKEPIKMSEAGNFRCTGEARLGTLSVLGFSGPDFSQLSSFICSREVPTHKLATKDKARETGTKAGVGGWRRECSANKGFQHNADPREVESGGWGDRRKGEGDQRVLNCS